MLDVVHKPRHMTILRKDVLVTPDRPFDKDKLFRGIDLGQFLDLGDEGNILKRIGVTLWIPVEMSKDIYTFFISKTRPCIHGLVDDLTPLRVALLNHREKRALSSTDISFNKVYRHDLSIGKCVVIIFKNDYHTQITIFKMDRINIRQYTVVRRWCIVETNEEMNNTPQLFILAPESSVEQKIRAIEMEGRNLVIKTESGNDIVFLNVSKTEKRELKLIN